MKTAALSEQIYGPIRLNDAEIEIVEVIVEHPWGAVSCPPHVHSWFEFNYIYEGTMQTGFGGPMLDVGPGEFFLIPPGVEHGHKYVPDAPHKGICLRWTVKPALDGEREETDGGIFGTLDRLRHWQPGCYPDRYELGERLQQLFREAESPSGFASVQLAIVQFLLALASIREPQGRLPVPSGMTDAAFLRKIEIYLSDQRAERMNVRLLAASLHMSYHHLARKYKKLTGKTVVERLTEIRIERAADLLARTDAAISDIAEVSGFATAYYFSRVFKQAYGVSPRAYRDSVKTRPLG